MVLEWAWLYSCLQPGIWCRNIMRGAQELITYSIRSLNSLLHLSVFLLNVIAKAWKYAKKVHWMAMLAWLSVCLVS